MQVLGARLVGRSMAVASVVFAALLVVASFGAAKRTEKSETGKDPLAKRQYALQEINGRNPGRVSRRDPEEVTLAIVDTGLDLDHPDLEPRLWENPAEVPGPNPPGPEPPQGPVPRGAHGWDLIGTDAPPAIAPDSEPDDPISHGTPVGSVAAAATLNRLGMAGVAPNARLMALRTCWAAGGSCEDDITAGALDWAAANGARVVNLSLIVQGAHDLTDAAIRAHPETLFVAAAANQRIDLDLPALDTFPCETPAANVICVAATTRGGGLASCSNFGRSSVDVAAPGEGLTVAGVGGGFVENHPCGTSLATPHVSGLAALLFGAVPEASAAEVKAAILNAVRPVPALQGKVATGGIINAKGSLKLLQDAYGIPKPPKTGIREQGKASFELRSTGGKGKGFECSLDGERFRRCPRLVSFDSIEAGRHTLEARARGLRGTVDPSPARRRFRVPKGPA